MAKTSWEEKIYDVIEFLMDRAEKDLKPGGPVYVAKEFLEALDKLLHVMCYAVAVKKERNYYNLRAVQAELSAKCWDILTEKNKEYAKEMEE